MTGNDIIESSIKIGNVKVVMHNKSGDVLKPLRLRKVSHTPVTVYNLTSIMEMVNELYNLKSKRLDYWETSLILPRGDYHIVFDIMFKMTKGDIYFMIMSRVEVPKSEIGVTSIVLLKKLPPCMNPKITLTIDDAHVMFGHYDEDNTRQCTYTRGYGISRRTLKPCTYCDMAKTKQKSAPK